MYRMGRQGIDQISVSAKDRLPVGVHIEHNYEPAHGVDDLSLGRVPDVIAPSTALVAVDPGELETGHGRLLELPHLDRRVNGEGGRHHRLGRLQPPPTAWRLLLPSHLHGVLVAQHIHLIPARMRQIESTMPLFMEGFSSRLPVIAWIYGRNRVAEAIVPRANIWMRSERSSQSRDGNAFVES